MLGLTRADADRPDWRTVLKRAYRALALLFHPDKNPRDPEAAGARFLEISEAYKTLADDAARARYDGTGVAGVHQPETEGRPWGAERPTKPDADGFGSRERGPPKGGAPRIGSFSLINETSTRTGSRGGGGCTRRPARTRTGRVTCPRRGARTRARVATSASRARGRAVRGDSARPDQGRADGGDGLVEPAKLGAREARGEPPRVPDPGGGVHARARVAPGGGTEGGTSAGGESTGEFPDGPARVWREWETRALRLLVRERLRALVSAVAAALTPGEGTGLRLGVNNGKRDPPPFPFIRRVGRR